MRMFGRQTTLGDSPNSNGLTIDHLVMTAVVSTSIFFVLLLSEVSLSVSIISSAFLAFQILGGGAILILFSKRIVISWQGFCGIGIAVGSLLTIILDQIFRNTPISEIAWATPLIWIVFIGKKYGDFKTLNFSIVKNYMSELLFIFGIVFLVLTPEWFWTLPFAILMVITSVQFQKSKFHFSLVLAGLTTFLISIFSLFKRPVGWWIEDSDFALYEAISKTLSIWGFRDNINAAETSTNYHWFAYAWAGLVDRISSAPSWVSNTRIVPMMIVVGIVLVAWSILEGLSFSRKVIIGSLLIVGCFDTIQTWGRGFKLGVIASPSQIYGTLLLLTFIYFFILFNEKRLRFSLPLFFALGFSVVGAKVAHGVILAGAIGAVWLFGFLKTKTVLTHQSLQVFAVLIAIYSSFFFIIGGGGGSSRGMLLDQVAFVDGITGDFRAYGLFVHWLAALILLFGMYGLQMFGVMAIVILYSSEQNYLKYFAIGASITGLSSAIFLSGEFAVELFFTHAASSVLIILIAPILLQKLMTRQNYLSKNYLIATIAIGLISAAIATSLPNLDSGSVNAIVLRTLPSLAGLLPMACAFLLILKSKKQKTIEQSIEPFLVLALAGLTALSIGFYSINFVKNIIIEYPSFESNYKDRTGEDLPDLIQVSAWINENVSEAEIFATNDFCREISESCNPDTDWDALLNFSMKCTTDQVLRSDDCNAGGYPLLTAIVDRRFLAGNYYVGISDGSAIKPWVVNRVLDSVNFAKSPSTQSTQKLTSQGVDWFLLRRDLTSETNWSSFGTTEYSNDSYLVIELTTD